MYTTRSKLKVSLSLCRRRRDAAAPPKPDDGPSAGKAAAEPSSLGPSAVVGVLAALPTRRFVPVGRGGGGGRRGGGYRGREGGGDGGGLGGGNRGGGDDRRLRGCRLVARGGGRVGDVARPATEGFGAAAVGLEVSTAVGVPDVGIRSRLVGLNAGRARFVGLGLLLGLFLGGGGSFLASIVGRRVGRTDGPGEGFAGGRGAGALRGGPLL
mmetsp:Transcript_17544/g.52661  ORF Transcript_17544/g.52661 Transcript_17544/m.52661 type:complete len:211 (+) Transcript_17544:8323-8955(+)